MRQGNIYSVVIVGAGPTGLVIANLLGRDGVDALLVERNESTVQEPRAVSIDDESLRTLQAAGLLDQVSPHIVPGYGSHYFTPGGRCFLKVEPSGQPYGHPKRNAFRQPVLEAELRAGLSRFPHIETMFGWTMVRLSQDERGVDLELARGSERWHVRSTFLVGADGASSAVRKQLGITLEGATLAERWLIIDLENSPVVHRHSIVFCNWRRPCIALPGPNLTRRFEFKLRPGEAEGDLLEPNAITTLLEQHGAAPESRLKRKVVYTFHARIAKRWSVGRVFLAGDAAHLSPPFAGQGMNSGIRDAHNIAWKLAMVIQGKAPRELLDSYESERRGHVGSMIALALRMGRIMGPSGPIAAWLTQVLFTLAGLWPTMRAYFAEMKYKPKPKFDRGFVLDGNHPLIGRMLPQFQVGLEGKRVLLDELLGNDFALVGVGISVEALRSATQGAVWGNLHPRRILLVTGSSEHGSSDITVANAESSDLAPLKSVRGSSILLVRPDRYVMAGGDAVQIQRATMTLAKLLSNGSTHTG